MEIRSIVNTGIPDLKTCESEPIHFPGSIQPHGFLLGVRQTDRIISYCSANTSEFLKLEPAQILNNLLKTVLPTVNEWLDNWAGNGMPGDPPRAVSVSGETYDLTVSLNRNVFILEFEPHGPSADTQALFDQTRQFVTNIEKARSLQELCRSIADETRRLTGYDRVMIYRFDKTYNGEVYAESRREDLEPLLGLHYPHTDIPPQARELYLSNLLRIIVDVSYEPVPLLTIDNASNRDLDLGNAKLRSVSPIHIQYLKNMGVGATLTVSLLQDGSLWGLIACHHYGPKYLSHAQRQTALLQGHFLSSQIKVRQVAEEYEVNIVVEAHLQQLLNRLDADEDFDQKFSQFTSILQVANASGVAILRDGVLYRKGLTPSEEKTRELVRWIDRNSSSIQFCTAHLAGRYPEAEAIGAPASGILYHALGKPLENCIIWFREEVQRTINWAGNPNEAVQKTGPQQVLTPRRSFAIWKEQVRFHSAEWRTSEINAAQRFASSLQNQFHLAHLRKEDYKLRVLNDKLQKANQELSNINWITSHDLKEPLRKIHIFASKIMSEEGQGLSELIRHSIARIQKSAVRMQHLVEDILSYSIAGNREKAFAATDLNAILDEVLEDLTEELKESAATVKKDLLPRDAQAIPYQMQQLFYNLLSNALKFADPAKQLEITISCNRVKGADVPELTLAPADDFYEMRIEDNGIGFDPTQNKKIFDIFYRLHHNDLKPGTGIGLAICKKIMENHNGAIVASATENRGASFTAYLPA